MRQTRSSSVYPDALTPFLAGCIFLHMWFYNLSLKGCGVSFASWYDRTVKAVLPRSRADVKLSDSYKFDALKDKWKRKRPPWSPRIKHLTMLLSVLASAATQSHTFELRSDVAFRKKLRKYRTYLGDLDTRKVPKEELSALHRRINDNSASFKQVAQGSMSVTSSVVDTGASASCLNSLKDVDPTSIRRLDKPV